MWMCRSKKLEVTWVFLDSIDAWGQQFTSFMTFVVVLICGGFQCWPVSCNYVNFYNFLFCAIVLIWRKTNKDVSVVICKNDMTPQKEPTMRKFKKKSVINNEKTIAYYWCWGHLIRTYCFLWSISHWKPEIVYSCNIEK